MFEQLMHQADGDEQLQEMFSVVAAIENPQPYYKQQLARTLMNNGHYRDALIVLPTFEPNDQIGEILLRCSFQAQWWQLFDRSVRKLPSGEEKNFWQGLQALPIRQIQACSKTASLGRKSSGAVAETLATGARDLCSTDAVRCRGSAERDRRLGSMASGSSGAPSMGERGNGR